MKGLRLLRTVTDGPATPSISRVAAGLIGPATGEVNRRALDRNEDVHRSWRPISPGRTAPWLAECPLAQVTDTSAEQQFASEYETPCQGEPQTGPPVLSGSARLGSPLSAGRALPL